VILGHVAVEGARTLVMSTSGQGVVAGRPVARGREFGGAVWPSRAVVSDLIGNALEVFG